MITPLYNNILVRMDVPKEISKNGIIVPLEVSASKSPTGIVMSIGSKVQDVYVGDKVLMPLGSRDRGTPVTMGGTTCYIISIDSILAVLN